MQTVSIRDILHEMSNPVFCKNKKQKNTNLLSAEVKEWIHFQGQQLCQNSFLSPSEKGSTLIKSNLDIWQSFLLQQQQKKSKCLPADHVLGTDI